MSAAGGGGGAATSNGPSGGAAPIPCTTRITYGHAWLRPPNHPEDFDVVDGEVTWDGLCGHDADNAFATLSNGWKPYFSGHAACTLALDTQGDCGSSPMPCATRIGYGPTWNAPPNHPDTFDDVSERVYADGVCRSTGGGGHAMRLSNGWDPHFTGTCELSFRSTRCGGLYANPVVPSDCPDPGVTKDGDSYLKVCTSADLGGLFPIEASKDLLHWTPIGHVFPNGQAPPWATADFWAPELHKVGSNYVAVFSARHTSGSLAVGLATSATAQGPYVDLGKPLVHEATVGHIDAHVFDDGAGSNFLVWKDDGNAFGKPTPIWGQRLGLDGASLVGAKTQLLTNDQGWEGTVVEGPWVHRHDGAYYLFYSGNAYYNASYAVGVARATSPLGPYTKLGAPILGSNGAWAGPGHGSVVPAPHGGDVFVYHAWRASNVNAAPGRLVLVDRIAWGAPWPSLPTAPSFESRPLP